MSDRLLSKINSPADLKALPDSDIPALAQEIRAFLTERVERSGGHLASNLGAVELTLAIHRVFDSPVDRIIFDVGHQSYVHKMLTGRRGDFDRLREPGGLSGFTSRRESEHDPFGAGHSSTSISAALGFAEADALRGERRHTVCVIGDGACTGGMVHEALNNCKPELPMVIVINENGMSISSTKGAFTSYLSRVRISRGYRSWKSSTNAFLSKMPLLGRPLRALMSGAKELAKRILYRNNYFESLGLYYVGPIDGNDYEKTVRALEEAKSLGGTVVVHLKTVKGKGYSPAESAPDSYHNVSAAHGDGSFHSVAAQALVSLGEKDESVVAVTAAMGAGTGLERFGDSYPDRYFDVGIAEPHAITFSAGLAAAGMKPYAAIYSTFLQRAYDSVLHDVALQRLPVRMLIDRAGLAAADGATHHGIFDVAFLSEIPELTVLAPASYASLCEMIAESADAEAPLAIRYANAAEPHGIVDRFRKYEGRVLSDIEQGDCPEFVFITYGAQLERVAAARDILAERGIRVGIVVLEQLKPLGAVARTVAELTRGARRILFAEEGIRAGGAAMLLCDELMRLGVDVSGGRYLISAVNDDFASPTEPCDIYEFAGLDPRALVDKITESN